MTAKVAFITGSAKRIGAGTARHLHQLGYNIVLHCNRSHAEAQGLLAELNQLRIKSCGLVQGPLDEVDKLPDLANQATAVFGRIDVLVNNASSFYPTPIGSITNQDWQQLVGSNMQAPLFLSQHLKLQLEQNQGVIINMVDIHAEKPLKDHTLYCMAKAALVAMTKSLAQELAPAVRVNGVAPGAILWPEQTLAEQEKEQIINQIPARRLGEIEDIAGAIGYLVQAEYVTGQILAVDGGRSIGSTSKA